MGLVKTPSFLETPTMPRDLHLVRSSSTFFKSGMWFNLIKSASLVETLIPKYLIFQIAVEWRIGDRRRNSLEELFDFNQFIE